MEHPIEHRLARPAWLTYAQASERLGLSPEAVRHRARRAGWHTMPGNNGRTLVLVPDDEEIRPRAPVRTPEPDEEICRANARAERAERRAEEANERASASLSVADGADRPIRGPARNSRCRFLSRLVVGRRRSLSAYRSIAVEWRGPMLADRRAWQPTARERELVVRLRGCGTPITIIANDTGERTDAAVNRRRTGPRYRAA